MKRRGFLQAMLGLLLIPKEWNLLPPSFNPEVGRWKHVLVSWDIGSLPGTVSTIMEKQVGKVAAVLCDKSLMDKGNILADSRTGTFSAWIREDGTTLYKHDAGVAQLEMAMALRAIN